MSKKTKKQNRRLHNKKSKANPNSKVAKNSQQQQVKTTTFGGSSVTTAGNSSKPTGAKKNNSNVKVKKRYVMTDKVKTFFTVTICVVMVLAFAIPTGLSMILNSSAANTANENQVQDSKASLTGLTRDMKDAFDETGKFDNFLVVDESTGIRLQELYDGYKTIDEVRILEEREKAKESNVDVEDGAANTDSESEQSNE